MLKVSVDEENGRLKQQLADERAENVRLFEEVQARTRELTEALEFQTATSDVLNVISRSPSDIQPVLDAIVDTAARLCRGDFAIIWKLHEDRYHAASIVRDTMPELAEYARANPISPGRGTLVGRVALQRATVHIPDVTLDPEYRWSDGRWAGLQRTMLGVPLLHRGTVIGVIVVHRRMPQPFSQREIDLVTTFADQAVIAIENVRLFEEVQARTAELQESLEYQTATSDVLNVISRSPSDLQPVLDAIVETAARLCARRISRSSGCCDGRSLPRRREQRTPRRNWPSIAAQHPDRAWTAARCRAASPLERRRSMSRTSWLDPEYQWSDVPAGRATAHDARRAAAARRQCDRRHRAACAGRCGPSPTSRSSSSPPSPTRR